jgi:tRNA G18 (ribose-2'-O)-methylase SpoU
MNKDPLVRTVHMIEHHSVFSNVCRNKKEPVWIQLMVTLCRLGCHGNEASIVRSAMMFGVSHVQLLISLVVCLQHLFLKKVFTFDGLR